MNDYESEVMMQKAINGIEYERQKAAKKALCPNCHTPLIEATVSDDIWDDGILLGWYDAMICLTCDHKQDEHFVKYRHTNDTEDNYVDSWEDWDSMC